MASELDSQSSTPKVMRWAGYVVSALPVLLLLMSAAMKLAGTEQVVEGFAQQGYAPNTRVPIALAELISTVLYIIPQTAVLGAILLTGYLGGAVSTHVRAADGMFFSPVLFGVFIWLGLFLRDARIRALVPWRRR
jgi:sorbitol-specific phosphotransferase system component IIC